MIETSTLVKNDLIRGGFMKLISLLVFLFAFTAQAKVCDLSQTLTKKQIKLLKKAQKLKRFGPNRSLFGKNVYKVDLLSNDDKLLVLVGEAHIKGPRSSRLGKKIVKAFDLRMLEGVPMAEVKYIEKNNEDLDDALGWQRTLAKISTFNFAGSTISVAQKRGLTFLPGYDAILLDNDVIQKEKTETAKEVLYHLSGLIQNADQGLNLPLEVGPFLTPSEEDSYLLEARNVRMVSNILTYLGSRDVRGTPLIIVGAAHNPGMIKLLNNDGYERCNL